MIAYHIRVLFAFPQSARPSIQRFRGKKFGRYNGTSVGYLAVAISLGTWLLLLYTRPSWRNMEKHSLVRTFEFGDRSSLAVMCCC